MTVLQLVKRLALTWFGVSWFAYFALDTLGHYDLAGQILRAIVAGFFVALSTAPAYYWRLRQRSDQRMPNKD